MENLELYNKVRNVPNEAKKSIGGGRLKGMTDINPMWRIKTLTENFGPCGFGWTAPIINKWIEKGHGNESVANVEIALRVKQEGEWSEPICGIGGSMFVANEKNGPFTSDEAFKMAYTDAISVACKMLGFGADVYWDKDRTKYDTQTTPEPKQPEKPEAVTNEEYNDNMEIALQEVEDCQLLIELEAIWKKWPAFQKDSKFKIAVTSKKSKCK